MKPFSTTTLAIALIALVAMPVHADKKKDDDKKSPGKSDAAKKKDAPNPVVRTNPSARGSRDNPVERQTTSPVARRSAAPVAASQTRALRSEASREDFARTSQARQPGRPPRERPAIFTHRSGKPALRQQRHQSWGLGSRPPAELGALSQLSRAPPIFTRGWDHNRSYSWNQHRYHWYEGSWVIIDPGYAYVESSNYAPSHNVVADVQAELQRAGYRPGPADGMMGGQTRSAISQYQSDRGLRVTGGIDRTLLASLGLAS